MQKISALLILASIVIVACMVYLLKTGISLTPAVLIRPSTANDSLAIYTAVTHRLFPNLSQNKDWEVYVQESFEEQTRYPLSRTLLKEHPQVQLQILKMNNLDADLQPSSSKKIYVEFFDRNEFSLSPDCEHSKRLNYRCFVEVSLHKSRRKMKDSAKKYFMMTSYLDTHFLVLIQN